MKLLFVVHRAYPYPGGSEYYVQNMAEEAASRGHDVTILAHETMGGNPLKVTNDYQILMQDWHLIIVHGSDVISQNIVHANAGRIESPVLYLIIKPSESNVSLMGLSGHDYLGYSTSKDIEYLKKHDFLDRARRVRHGIPLKTDMVVPDEALMTFNITSGGGFYPHKGMTELVEAFNRRRKGDMHLHLFGYGMPENAPEESEFVHVYKDADLNHFQGFLAFNTDIYVMNSFEEGFGLVLLESMLYDVPWAARKGVGAVDDLARHGITYNTEDELMDRITELHDDATFSIDMINEGYQYVRSNHTIQQTVDDIEDILHERWILY